MHPFAFPLALLLAWMAPKSIPPTSHAFPEVDPLSFCPFSSENLKLIAQEGIGEASIDFEENIKLVYFFDEQRRLLRGEQRKQKRKKEITKGRGRFAYDKAGNLCVAHWRGKFDSSYDSLAFDEEGRLTYLIDSVHYWGKLAKMQEVASIFRLHLLEKDEEKTVLEDRDRRMRYTFTPQNLLMRVEGRIWVDSLSLEKGDAGEEIRKYWFRKADSSRYRLGMERVYEGEKLATEIRYGYRGNSYNREEVQRTEYEYDKQGRLLLILTGGHQTWKRMYVYGPEGLLNEEQFIQEDEVSRTRYSYRRH